MRRTLLSGLLALPLLLTAQTMYFGDDFESYTPDTFLCSQTSDWIPWNNMPGSNQDVLVSAANAAMGVQSVVIESPGGNGPQDLLLPLGDQTSGQWKCQWYMYVESGNGGYFNFQKTASPGTEWAFDAYFNSDGSGYILQNDIEWAFSYTNGAWFHIEVWVDLDTDEARCFIEGVEVHDWQWTIDNQGDAGLNQLGGINYYAAADTGPAWYYIDEVEIYGPDAFATSIAENEGLSFDFFPNPVNEVLTISTDNRENSYFNIYDLTGKLIMENIAVSQNVNNTFVDVSELNSGIYLLEMTNNKQRFAKRFVKE